MKAIQADLQKLANMKITIDTETDRYDTLKGKILKQMADNNIDIIRDVEDDSLTVTCKKVGKRVFSLEAVKSLFGADASKCITESVSAKDFDGLVKEKEIKNADICFTTLSGTSQLTWGGLKEYAANKAKKEKTK